MMSVIDVNEVVFAAGGKKILDGVSLSVGKGKRLSIIGPNGAGKSTLLKCVMRLLPTTAGSITINGKETSRLTQKKLASMVGYVSQEPVPACPFSVEEFVLLSRYPHLSPFSRVRDEDLKAVDNALVTTGTKGLGTRSYDTLSGGEKQMVSIASVLAQGAEILLLDEPAAYLDPTHTRDVNGLIDRLCEDQRMTVLSVTHDINDALLCGGDICLIRRGRILFTGEAEQAVASGYLERLYGRAFEYSSHPATGDSFILPDCRRRR